MELCFVLLCKHTVFLCFFYVRTKRGQARHPARSPVPFPSNDTRSLNASLPATQAHSLPSFPRLPLSPAPCRHKAPPLGGQADDRAPLPNKAARPHRTPALFNSSTFGGSSLHPSSPPPQVLAWKPSSLSRCCLLSSPVRGRPSRVVWKIVDCEH